MRASHEDGYDGPANLRGAVAAAASPALRDTGVVVGLAGTIEAADDVTKMHTVGVHHVPVAERGIARARDRRRVRSSSSGRAVHADGCC